MVSGIRDKKEERKKKGTGGKEGILSKEQRGLSQRKQSTGD
jgi:hypothetical protein